MPLKASSGQIKLYSAGHLVTLPLWMQFVSGEFLTLQCCGFACEAIRELVLHV